MNTPKSNCCENGKIPCSCPKGGKYEIENGSWYECEKCGGSEWVDCHTPHTSEEKEVFHTGGALTEVVSDLDWEPPKSEENSWEKEFDEQFKGLTLGILSGDKDSPVFHNNELELPRLRNFISQTLQKEKTTLLLQLEKEIENKREVYDDDVDQRNDKYRFEGFNRALEEIRALIRSKLK